MGMKSILVACKNSSAAETIVQCLGKEYRVEFTVDRQGCLDMFRRKRREYTFIDLDILGSPPGSGGRTNYKEMFKPFWQAFPTLWMWPTHPLRFKDTMMLLNKGRHNLDPHLSYC